MARSDDVLPLVAPPPVAALAQQLRLGALLERVGREDNMRTMARFLLISGIGSLVLSCVALLLPARVALLPGGLFLLVAIALFAYGIVALIRSIITMVRPTPHRFLYEGGVVQEVGNKVSTVQWSDITELEVQYFGEGTMFNGKIKGYLMRLRGGGQVKLPSADSLDRRGPFEDRMMELIRAAGVKTTQRIA